MCAHWETSGRWAYLQGGGGADMCRGGVPLPALQPVDVAHTRTRDKEQLAATLPDLQVVLKQLVMQPDRLQFTGLVLMGSRLPRVTL